MQIKSKKIESGICLLAFLLVLAFHLSSLMNYPKPFLDEAVTLRGVYQYTGKAKEGFFEPLFELTGGDGLTTKAYQPVYAFFTSLFPLDEYFAIRLATLSFGLLLLCSCFLIAKHIGGTLAGLFTMIFLAVSWPFLIGAHVARHDMIGLAIGYSVFAYSLFSRKTLLRGFICGVLMTVGFYFHPRSAVAGGVLFFYIFYDALRDRSQRYWLAGYVIGGGISLLGYFIERKAFAPASSSMLRAFYEWRRPAIFTFDFSEILASMVDAATYLYEVSGTAAVLFVIPIFLLFDSNREKAVRCIILFVSSVVIGGLLVVAKTSFKAISFSPFSTIVMGVVLSQLFSRSATRNVGKLEIGWKGVTLAAAILSFIHVSSNVKAVLATDDTCLDEFNEIGSELKAVILPSDVIVGEELYWLHVPRDKFYSIRTIPLYRKIHSDSSLDDAMKLLTPDVLIVDAITDFYIGQAKMSDRFNQGLQLPGEALASFVKHRAVAQREFASQCFGSVRVIRLRRD